MGQDNRKFTASISVRLARRWLDTKGGTPRWFDQEGIARLAAELALQGLKTPAPAPNIPCPPRVSVRRRKNGFFEYEGTWTNTLPILDYTGRWVVSVSLDGKRIFVPVEDVTIHGGRRG